MAQQQLWLILIHAVAQWRNACSYLRSGAVTQRLFLFASNKADNPTTYMGLFGFYYPNCPLQKTKRAQISCVQKKIEVMVDSLTKKEFMKKQMNTESLNHCDFLSLYNAIVFH